MKLTKLILKQIALSGLLLLIATGCEDFLSENNKSALTQDNYYKNASQAQSAVDGIYVNLRTWTNYLGYGEKPWSSLELLVGHANTNGQSDFNRELIQHDAGTDHPAFSDVWNNFYNGIANANVAIKNIPDVQMDEQLKSKLLGEARFLRAYFYFNLVRLYGNIPLITEPVDAGSNKLHPEQASVEDVYEQIVADLKSAEQSNLPLVDRTGRASKGAVKALLSNVYLSMAGYPVEGGDEYYELAADKAEEVIDSNQYPLFENYDYLHDREHQNQKEFIFQVQYESGIAEHQITPMIVPENIGITPYTDEFGALVPIDEFVESYEDGDLRTEEQEFYFSEYTMPDGSTVEFGAHALYKYWLDAAANPQNGDQHNDLNWTLYRMPEVMLIYAEAINEVNGGPNQKAYEQINAIRERANLDPLSGLSQQEFRRAVWKERYHELAFENKAYFDIQRTHMVYDLVDNEFVNAFDHTNVQGTRFTEQYMLWPIPQSEMQANSNLKQNPGW